MYVYIYIYIYIYVYVYIHRERERERETKPNPQSINMYSAASAQAGSCFRCVGLEVTQLSDLGFSAVLILSTYVVRAHTALETCVDIDRLTIDAHTHTHQTLVRY